MPWFLLSLPALAAPWEDATPDTIGPTAEWSSKVLVADLTGNGDPDIVFANGSGYSTPGTREINRAWTNAGGTFTEIDLFTAPDHCRSIKAGDVDGDGDLDVIAAGNYGDPSTLLLRDGDGWTDASERLTDDPGSFGDLELGDMDGDGDLDVVLADWGAGNALTNGGAPIRLWRNDDAVFTRDVGAVPDVAIGMSWDLELVDVDNDMDLDVLVSCKVCDGSYLFHNDGTGQLTDASDRLPQFSNNYELEAMDLNGDGFLDLVTINDGPNLREHVFLADGSGGFTDATADLWPAEANIGEDDNVVVFLDYESDGDADFVIGSLSGDDRLLLNDGTGHLSLLGEPAFMGTTTPGTLGMAVADLNGDAQLDIVQSQGEVASPDKVFFGTDIDIDTAPPVIDLVTPMTETPLTVRARIHDRKSTTPGADFAGVELQWETPSDTGSTPMTWTGEYLWRAELPAFAPEGGQAWICATDVSGNEACSTPQDLPHAIEPPDDDVCGCTTGGAGGALLWLALVALVRRRR